MQHYQQMQQQNFATLQRWSATGYHNFAEHYCDLWLRLGCAVTYMRGSATG